MQSTEDILTEGIVNSVRRRTVRILGPDIIVRNQAFLRSLDLALNNISGHADHKRVHGVT